MTIAMHQANYLPWIGFFDKLQKADVFVIFDDIQLPLRKNFETTAIIKSANGPLELVVPVKNRNGKILEKDAGLLDMGFKKKHLKSVEIAYSKAPYYNDYIRGIRDVYGKDYNKLVDFNIAFINLISEFLHIKTKLVLSSSLNIQTHGEDKIIDTVKVLGGDTYISGTGAGSRKYVRDEDFNNLGIKLIWQDFQHPVYGQLYGDFVPGLSIIDYLFNEGGKLYETF